jgi:hypothetical protein
LTQKKAKLCKKFDHNIGFWEKKNIFSPKIAENCGHNIDPRFCQMPKVVGKCCQEMRIKLIK